MIIISTIYWSFAIFMWPSAKHMMWVIDADAQQYPDCKISPQPPKPSICQDWKECICQSVFWALDSYAQWVIVELFWATAACCLLERCLFLHRGPVLKLQAAHLAVSKQDSSFCLMFPHFPSPPLSRIQQIPTTGADYSSLCPSKPHSFPMCDPLSRVARWNIGCLIKFEFHSDETHLSILFVCCMSISISLSLF